jgi:hypothetical protein
MPLVGEWLALLPWTISTTNDHDTCLLLADRQQTVGCDCAVGKRAGALRPRPRPRGRGPQRGGRRPQTGGEQRSGAVADRRTAVADRRPQTRAETADGAGADHRRTPTLGHYVLERSGRLRSWHPPRDCARRLERDGWSEPRGRGGAAVLRGGSSTDGPNPVSLHYCLLSLHSTLPRLLSLFFSLFPYFPLSPLSLFPSFPLSLFPSFPLSLFPSFPLSLFPSFPLSLFPSFPVSLFPSFPLSLFPSFPASHKDE